MKILFTYCFSLFSVFIFSQIAPEIVWQISLGGTSYELEPSLVQTPDNGIMVIGSTTSNNGDVSGLHSATSYDGWIVKLDSLRNIEWQRCYGGKETDFFSGISKTSTGYIVAAQSQSINGDVSGNHGFTDFWIFTIDESGGFIWKKCYGGGFEEGARCATQTAEGGYIVSGSTATHDGNIPDNHGSYDTWVLKLNSTGAATWKKCYGGSLDDYNKKVLPLDDGGYIILGHTNSIDGYVTGNHGGNDIWLAKIDSDGVLQWSKCYGGSLNEYAVDIAVDPAGGYFVGAITASNDGDITLNHGFMDFWCFRTDADGNLIWQKTYGGSETEEMNKIIVTADGFSVLGFSVSSDFDLTETHGGGDLWIARMDTAGEILWQKSFGGSLSDVGFDFIMLGDTSYLVAGVTISSDFDVASNHGQDDLWVLEISPGDSSCVIASSITPSGPTSFCAGESIILNAPVDASYTYQWKKNGVNISGATSSSFTANVTGQYQVFISNGTCDDISDSLLVIKNPKPNPTITNADATNDLCFDSAIKLKTTAVAGSSYQWYKGASLISGAISNVYLATTIGNYKVKVTNAAGCFKLSAPYNIIKTCRLGYDEIVKDIILNIYPNPNNGTFTLQFNNASDELISISIKNMLGEEIYTEQITTSELSHTITLDKNIPEGIYIISMQRGINLFSQQIIITK